jgi:uncharacterized protein (TIGR00375 family)
MIPESLWRWAQLKGITVIGTGDVTHPKWFKELNDRLEPLGTGLYRLKKSFQGNGIPASCRSDVFFILTAEISCIYKKNGKTRKVHALALLPDFASAAKMNLALAKIGNINADGRPILGLDAKELLRIVLDASPDALFVPAHIWTPHFSVFGAASGFDSLEECFDELTPHILALETGLSSDPLMNWRLSALDHITLMSNSDAHSPAKIGREANVFDTAISYSAMLDAIKTRKGFAGTIEFFPEEGKYHYDGHRDCGISLKPQETLKHNYLCPMCGKSVTVGVLHRVEVLADRDEGLRPKGAPAFRSAIPLPEIIAETLKVGVATKAVDALYQKLLADLGNEFHILMDAPLFEISRSGTPLLAEAVGRMRKGKVFIAPGYDGEYGKIRIFEEVERTAVRGQTMLF